MYERQRGKYVYNIFTRRNVMNMILNLIQKIFIFEKEPQKIGLTQLKESVIVQKNVHSIKNKDVKLSDLMRRAS